MNQNIPENFNLIKALNYLKKNDKSQSFTLKDIKNEENYFYNKLNNSKPTIIQTNCFIELQLLLLQIQLLQEKQISQILKFKIIIKTVKIHFNLKKKII